MARICIGEVCVRSTTSSRQVKRVAARPRGVRRAVVERVEVVVHGLDLGTLDHGEAQAEEDVFQLARGLREDVQASRPAAAGCRAA